MRYVLITLTLLFATSSVYPHGGGIDSQGGHNDNSAGNYHFHQGPLAGEIFASKEEGAAALEVEIEPGPATELPTAQLL